MRTAEQLHFALLVLAKMCRAKAETTPAQHTAVVARKLFYVSCPQARAGSEARAITAMANDLTIAILTGEPL